MCYISAPENVADFKAVDQNESSITLQSTKIPHILNVILEIDGAEENFTADELNETTRYTVTNLNSSRQYRFTLFTVFKGVQSTGANLTATTGNFPSVLM